MQIQDHISVNHHTQPEVHSSNSQGDTLGKPVDTVKLVKHITNPHHLPKETGWKALQVPQLTEPTSVGFSHDLL